MGRLGRRLRRDFLAGILVMVPVGATLLILVWIFTRIDNILQPIIRLVVGKPVPGIGFVITIVLIYLVGLVVSNVVGRSLLRYGEFLLARVPVVRPLYSTIKQMLAGFSTPGRSGFGQTVLVEFPRKGMWAIGFITNEFLDQSGEKRLNVFIPTAPNPTTGFLEIVREEEIVRTEIPVDKALQMVISAGKVSPREISDFWSGRVK